MFKLGNQNFILNHHIQVMQMKNFIKTITKSNITLAVVSEEFLALVVVWEKFLVLGYVWEKSLVLGVV